MICRKISNGLYIFLDISLAQTVKDPPANSNDSGSIPGSGRPPGDGNCNSLYYYCLENPMEWRSLAGYSLWDCKESDMTEWVGIHIFFSNIFKLIGKIKLYTVQIIFFLVDAVKLFPKYVYYFYYHLEFMIMPTIFHTVSKNANCRKFLKKWEYWTTLPVSWENCMQVKKQQLEPDIEQKTGSKLGKEYVKAVYCHSAY